MESPWVKAGLRLLVTLEMGELLVNRITWWYGMQGLGSAFQASVDSRP